MISYKAKYLESISNGPGMMNSIRVGIFEEKDGIESKIGEYIRNYGLFNTFCHFRQNGRDYALYSPDYTATRVLELPSCKDLGGEDPNPMGFCPVDFYVPCYIDREFDPGPRTRELIKKDTIHYRVHDPEPKDLQKKHEISKEVDIKTNQTIEENVDSFPVSELIYYPFGFVAGCQWGDDSSWKLQFLDLSKVKQGIISRKDIFGYVRLSHGKSLKDAIEIICSFDKSDKPNPLEIEVSSIRLFEIDGGKEIDNAD